MSNLPPQQPADGSSESTGFGPGGLPRHPGTPSEDAAVSRVPQPPSIRNAVRLMQAGAAISLVSLVVTLTMLGSLKSDVRDSMTKADSQVTQSAIDAAYVSSIVATVVSVAIAIFLWLWMAWKNGQGRKWARVVATVLGAINVLSTLFTATSGNANTVSVILSVVNLVLAVVILFLLWRKESSDFYAARSASGPAYG